MGREIFVNQGKFFRVGCRPVRGFKRGRISSPHAVCQPNFMSDKVKATGTLSDFKIFFGTPCEIEDFTARCGRGLHLRFLNIERREKFAPLVF